MGLPPTENTKNRAAF